MRPIPTLLVSATIAATSSAALAQAITIDVENPVLLPGESTTVTMWAGFGGTDYAMADIETDLLISQGSDGWSDAIVVAPMDGPATTAGSPSASGYDGIVARQLNFPGGAGIFADPSNPIAFWQATYTAPLDASAPFDVDLSTMTIRYDVFIWRDQARSESRLADLTEGSATIRVIPAPASALVLTLGAFVARRRR
ncbi:MAG: hypothetical protein ACIAQU_10785 [Phycisphaerales bacterium JB064]